MINKKELLRTVKYFMFAVSAAVIQMIVAFVLELAIFKKVIPDGATLHFIADLDKSSFIAESIGLACSIVWNFTFNRKYTFKAATNVPISIALAFLFYVPFYPFQIWYIDAVRAALLASIGEDWAFVIAQVTVILLNGVLEFLWQRFVVFGKKVDTNQAAIAETEKDSDEVKQANTTAEGENGTGVVEGNAVNETEKNDGEETKQ